MMKRVFVTRVLPGNALKSLNDTCQVVNTPTRDEMSDEELISTMREVDGMITTLGDTIDAVVMERAGRGLKVISNYAVGYNNIDMAEATERGIVVCNTPDVLTDATADLAFAMLLTIARHIHKAHDFSIRGMFTGWEPELFLGLPVWGKTIGILGMGKIGSAVAMRAKGFNMNILYHNRNKVDEQREAAVGAHYVSLEELLSLSDFLVIVVPLTDETKGMIGKDEIATMKPHACLINISRGEVVKEGELARALKEGTIMGAALDVYEREPEIHPELFLLDNVLLLPHIGSATFDARGNMARLCVNNLLSVLRGDEPPASVNYHLIKK